MMYRILIGIVLLQQSLCDQDGTWCNPHDHEHVDFYHEVKEHLGVTTANLTASDVQNITTQVFFRVKCDVQGVTGGCENCLTPSNIFQILKINPSYGLDEDGFYKFSTILVDYMRQLSDRCNQSDVIASSWTYKNFTDSFIHYDNHEETDHFSRHKLEIMLQDINATYRPGEYKVYNGSWTVEPDYSTVCQAEDSVSFRSRDIWASTHLEHADEGAEPEELGELNSNLIIRFLKGHCIRKDRSAIDGYPEADDFITATFNKYADHTDCKIYHEGLEELLKDVGVANKTNDDHKHEHEGENNGHEDDHDDHEDEDGHEEHAGHEVHDNNHEHEEHLSRRRRDADDHADEHEDEHHNHGEENKANVSGTCYTQDELLNILHLNDTEGIDQHGFMALSPLLIQQLTHRVCWPDADTHTGHTERLTEAQKYGYGTLAVLLISLMAIPGIIIVRFKDSPAYKYLLSTMLGLATGTLVGDATLHLVPHALGMHNHDEGDGHGHDHGHADGGQVIVEPFIWKMLVLNASLYGFFIMQCALNFFGKSRMAHNHEAEPEGTYRQNGQVSDGVDNKAFNDDNLKKKSLDHNHSDHHEMSIRREDSVVCPSHQAVTSFDGSKPVDDSMGWMIVVGDAVHNLADGMAIGSAFALDWRSGLSTSIAVLCHEIPHEFGDIAAMLSIGWRPLKVVALNMLSALAAFVGLYIGLPISQNEGAREWIFVVIAGMFIYVAVCDILPELLEMMRTYRALFIFLAAMCGICVGLGLMLTIAIFEDKIRV